MYNRQIKLDIAGATDGKIVILEKTTGITLTAVMKDFFRIMNGSKHVDAAIVTSNQMIPVTFFELDEILDYYDDYSELYQEALRTK